MSKDGEGEYIDLSETLYPMSPEIADAPQDKQLRFVVHPRLGDALRTLGYTGFVESTRLPE